MSVAHAFALAAQSGRAAFIPYVTGGFPGTDACLELITALDEAGADVIEVGLPFSDPLADGPTIQRTSQEALAAGATPAGVLELCAAAAAKVDAALVVMTYVNPVLKMGYGEFARRAADVGVAGVLIPDLPPEEAGPWLEAADAHGLEAVLMAAPTTPPQRVAAISAQGAGFLYYVSMTGVTGGELRLDQAARRALAGTVEASALPVAVGFGISRPQQARDLAGLAQGVVVGSALMRLMLEAATPRAGIAAAAGLARELAGAMTG